MKTVIKKYCPPPHRPLATQQQEQARAVRAQQTPRDPENRGVASNLKGVESPPPATAENSVPLYYCCQKWWRGHVTKVVCIHYCLSG
jgi:hypothetical protein